MIFQEGGIKPRPAEQQSNKFGVIRLGLALMVLVAHSYEMVDGSRRREPLTQMFGTLSFGAVAVDGFFLLSGYLIAQSALRSHTAANFLRKRILRIVPGFVVAYLITLFIIAPAAGGHLKDVNIGETLLRLSMLLGPKLDGAFDGVHFPQLNSSMWTIAYEFRCYILALALAWTGAYVRPAVYAGIVAAALALLVLHPSAALHPAVAVLVGRPGDTARLSAMFIVGSGFFVLRDYVPAYTSKRALVALAIGSLLMFSNRSAEVGVALFGGYALFWYALASTPTSLNQVGRTYDLSYGMYLYAWPIQNALMWFRPEISAGALLYAATILSAVAGWLSWTLVEAPALRLKDPRRRPPGLQESVLRA